MPLEEHENILKSTLPVLEGCLEEYAKRALGNLQVEFQEQEQRNGEGNAKNVPRRNESYTT